MNQTNNGPETRLSLIAKICDHGNDDAWTEFVQIYEPLVLRFVQRHGIQFADASEVTQEVLSRVAGSIESWDSQSKNSTFRGWIHRITRNLTIDFLRKIKSQRSQYPKDDASLSQIVDTSEDQSKEFFAEYEKQLFQWAAQKLKPTFKPTNWEAFWLSTVEGESIESVAKKLAIDSGAVYVARSRIMARLSKLIQKRLNETNPLSFGGNAP